MNIKPWMVISFIIFQLAFMVINESARIKASEDIQFLEETTDEIILDAKIKYDLLDNKVNDYMYHKHRYSDGTVINCQSSLGEQCENNQSKEELFKFFHTVP